MTNQPKSYYTKKIREAIDCRDSSGISYRNHNNFSIGKNAQVSDAKANLSKLGGDFWLGVAQTINEKEFYRMIQLNLFNTDAWSDISIEEVVPWMQMETNVMYNGMSFVLSQFYQHAQWLNSETKSKGE